MQPAAEMIQPATDDVRSRDRSARSVLNDVHARLNPSVPALQRRADSVADSL